MFEPFKATHLADALKTQNHFGPIVACFLVSLVILYYGGQFSASNKRKPPDVPDIFDPASKAALPPRPPKTLFEELKDLKNKFEIIRVVIYTLVLVICGTFLLLYLVRNNYVRFIRYWFTLAYFAVLSFFSLMLLRNLLKEAGVSFAIDLLTVLFLLWNISITGVNCVLFDGPVICYRLTLLYVSVIFACFLFSFIGSTLCWALIMILTVWDVVAVLTPTGPLKQLAEVNEGRTARVLNAIVYSANKDERPSTQSGLATKEMTSKELRAEVRKMKKFLQAQKNKGLDEEAVIRGLMLASGLEESNDCSIGLGDFVFFDLQIILIAELSRNPFFIFTGILLILYGLFITICFLTVHTSALPALPMSIALCQLGFLALYQFVSEIAELINLNMIFI